MINFLAGRNAQTTGQNDQHMKKTSFRACYLSEMLFEFFIKHPPSLHLFKA